MKLTGHIKLFLAVTIVWLIFWVAGLPDYYQQYSFGFMLAFDLALLIPFVVLVYVLLRKPSRSKIKRALWLSIYFTLPFFIYDYLYCGVYLNEGLQFVTTYWYLSVYYVVPWLVCVPMGLVMKTYQNP